MRNLILMITLTTILAIPAIGSIVELDDGEIHIVNDTLYENDSISLDYSLYYIPDKPTTSLILQSSGIIGGDIWGLSGGLITCGLISENV